MELLLFSHLYVASKDWTHAFRLAEHLSLSHLKKIRIIIFCVWVYCLYNICVGVYHVCAWCSWRSGTRIRDFCTIMWVLGITPTCSERAASTLCGRALSPVLCIVVFSCCEADIVKPICKRYGCRADWSPSVCFSGLYKNTVVFASHFIRRIPLSHVFQQ